MSGCQIDKDRVFGPRVSSDCRALDFTLYFEDLILVCIPSALFILLAPLRLLTLLRQSARREDRKILLALKIGVFATLFAVQVTTLSLRTQVRALSTSASIAADILSLLVTGFAGVLSFYSHHCSRRPVALLSWYLSALALFTATRTRTLWLEAPRDSVTIVLTSQVALICLSLVIESIEERQKSSNKLGPEQLSGPWNRTIFAWLAPLFRDGLQKILSLNDLPRMDTGLESVRLKNDLLQAWQSGSPRTSHRLLLASFRAYVLSFLSPILPRLCLAALTFAQPFLINTTVNFVNQSHPNQHHGRGLIGAWALVYLGMAVSNSIYQYQNLRFVTRLRGGLIALVYQRSLHAHSFQREDAAAVTLMSTDIERLSGGMQMFHDVWAALLSTGIAAWLLGVQLSLACLAPVILVVVFIAITSKISASSMHAQVHWIKMVQERLRVTTTMLDNLKSARMLGLSEIFSRQISLRRTAEIDVSTKYRKLLISILMLSITPVNLAPAVTFAVYAIIVVLWKNQTLLAAKAFTSVSLIALLTTPVIIFIQSLPLVIQCLKIFDRIQSFCEDNDADDPSMVSIFTADGNPDRVTAKTAEEGQPVLDEGTEMVSISHSVSAGKSCEDVPDALWTRCLSGGFLAIIGPIGSGKSLLLARLVECLTSECHGSKKSQAHLGLPTAVAYCAHDPWLQARTIRQNIIGASAFDELWYFKVRSACALDTDLNTLKLGDLTKIGNGGMKLSGGQKQRIALARAVYARSKFVVLDDVFSGMDARTAGFVSTQLFGKSGVFKASRSTVIFATHNARVAALADHVFVLENGLIRQDGCPAEVLEMNGVALKIGLEESQHEPKRRGYQDPQPPPLSAACDEQSKEEGELEHMLQDIRRKIGDASVYRYYMTNAGFRWVGIYITCIILWMFCTEFSTVIIKWWSEANSKNPNNQIGIWVGFYAMLSIAGTAAALAAAWVAFVHIISNTAARFHSDLLGAVTRAKFNYLARTSKGELLNRFSQDLELIDMELPMTMVNYTSTAVSVFIKLILLAVFSTYLGIAIPLVAIAIYFLQRFYLQTSRQMRLLSIEARAPLYTHFTESASGSKTIRAFGWQTIFEEQCYQLIDSAQRPVYLQSCVQHWLGFVLDIVVTILAVALVGTIVTWHGKFSAGSVGVSLLMIMSFSEVSTRLIQTWTKMESSVGAVARVKQFAEETACEHDGVPTHSMPPDWPQGGEIVLNEVTSSYSDIPDADIALKSVSLHIRCGQHVAICGRTGSGKTSLILTLLQMMHIRQGNTYIDGLDLATLPPDNVRRHLTTVTQDPLFMPGNLRATLDPHERSTDEDLAVALSIVGMRNIVESKGGLDQAMEDQTYSDGQKQLLCLVRALANKSKILILDEVASSVDHGTAAKIQDIIDAEFKECTVLAVMHRLEHIKRYDLVVVMDKGRVLEFGEPKTLLESGSHLNELYKHYEE